MRTCLLLIAALAALPVPALAATEPAPGAAHTKVTWGRVTRIDYHVGPGVRVHLATPSGPRELEFRPQSVPMRNLQGQTVGYADALSPGDEVRVFMDVGPHGELVPVEVTPMPPTGQP